MGDHKESDNFKAIGLPIMLIITMVLTIVVTRVIFWKAFLHAKNDLNLAIIFFGGLVCALLSVFLFPTAAWAFGVVNTLLAYMYALVCVPGGVEKFAQRLFALSAAWFLLLVGVPNQVSLGVIATITSVCDAWFGSKKEDMCKEGWLTLTEIVAMVMVSTNFFIMLTLMAVAFQGELVGIPSLKRGGGFRNIDDGVRVGGADEAGLPPPPTPQGEMKQHGAGYGNSNYNEIQ